MLVMFECVAASTFGDERHTVWSKEYISPALQPCIEHLYIRDASVSFQGLFSLSKSEKIPEKISPDASRSWRRAQWPAQRHVGAGSLHCATGVGFWTETHAH